LTVIIYLAVVFKISEIHKPCVFYVFNALACSTHLFLCSELSSADLTESIASELKLSMGIELSLSLLYRSVSWLLVKWWIASFLSSEIPVISELILSDVIWPDVIRLVITPSHYLCESQKLKIQRAHTGLNCLISPNTMTEGSIDVGKNLLKARVQMGKHRCADHRNFVYYKYFKSDKTRTQGV